MPLLAGNTSSSNELALHYTNQPSCSSNTPERIAGNSDGITPLKNNKQLNGHTASSSLPGGKQPRNLPANNQLLTGLRPEVDLQGTELRNSSQQHKWRQHPGGNRFFCNGRVLMSKQCSIFLLTVFLILFTMTLFCMFDLPYLITHISIEPVRLCLPLVTGVLFVLAMVNLFKTSFSDPGILPRATMREVVEMERQFNENQTAYNKIEFSQPKTKLVQVRGQTVKLKYCFTCCLFRPPRSSHCSVCDNCVLNFDHHCPWVGNCIGLRNYRHFYFFITILSLLDTFMGACVVVHLTLLTNEKGTFLDAVKESPPSLFTGLINVISIWSILGLSGFHTYLLAINQTTNEDIKGTFNTKLRPPIVNPYSSHNFFKNCCSILCAPEPPSLLDSHGLVDNASQEVVIDADLLARLTLAQSNLNANCQPSVNPLEQRPVIPATNNNVDMSFNAGNKHNKSSRSWNGAIEDAVAAEPTKSGGSQRAVRSGHSNRSNCSSTKPTRLSSMTPIQSSSSSQKIAAEPPSSVIEERMH